MPRQRSNLATSGSSVVLVERREVAAGASGGPGKRGVRANGRDPRELPLARQALGVWPRLADTLGADTGYQRLGGLNLMEKPRDAAEADLLARADSEQRVQSAWQIRTELISRHRVLDIEPGIASEVVAATYCQDDGIADHTATTRAYADAACRAGAELRQHTRAERIREQDGTVVVSLDDGTHLTATRGVFVLTNSHINDLLEPSFGVHVPIWRTAPQVQLVRAPTGYQPRVLIGHFTKKLAVKPLADGITMISGGLPGRWDETTDTGVPLDEMARQSLDLAGSVFPDLSGVAVLETNSSRAESRTTDGVPVIDVVPGTRNVYFATGWNGHGFAIAPAVAGALARWGRTSLKPPELAPFSAARLGVADASPGTK